MISADEFVNAARQLVGTPWRHRGRSFDGVDCIGLVMLAGKLAGVDLFALCGIHDRAYSRRPQRELFALVERHCRRTQVLHPGCLLLFRFPGDEYARHFGIYTDAGTMIHAECKTRKAVIEHGYRSQWVSWTHSRWLIPGLEYPEQ